VDGIQCKIDTLWRHTGPSRITSGTLRESTLNSSISYLYSFCAFF